MSNDFNPGTLYILNEDGSYKELIQINDSEIESVKNDVTVCEAYKTVSNLANIGASFECLARVTREAFLAMTGIKDAIIQTCPNRKVVHLAMYSRKKRTRKKNFNRAIKILEEIGNE